jgi:peptidoglycan hydrolase-like protein with peptidoglycan-binding domain
MKTGIKNSIIAIGVLGIFAGSTTITFAGYFNTTPISRCDVSISRQLQTGSENDDVYVLQQMLSRAGYLTANPNGFFGPATRSAVKRFQSDNNISATGVVGDATINAVNERLCDSDVRGDTLSYSNYGYSYATTYVDSYDPYVKVISPTPTNNPVIYSTPQADVSTSYTNNAYIGDYNNIPINSQTYGSSVAIITPATSPAELESTNIIYSPYLGYTYGIVPKAGSLTISTPLSNTVYKEGDTVYLAWTTNNLNASGYNILLENTITGQNKFVTSSQTKSTSFILTKDLLDAVCVGVCDNNQQGSFRVAITTPYKDISGNISTFRAAVSPITIKRPNTFRSVSISGSKNPVDSGERFKLYVNIPTYMSWNRDMYNQFSFKIHAICPSAVSVVIAGVSCGQDFTMPITTNNFQQEIPAMITNGSYYRQDVTFEIVVTDNLTGNVTGTARTTVTSNAAPFNW